MWQHTPVILAQEAEAGGLWVQGRPGLHSKALSKKKKNLRISLKMLYHRNAIDSPNNP
jgi:hypothetical protein